MKYPEGILRMKYSQEMEKRLRRFAKKHDKVFLIVKPRGRFGDPARFRKIDFGNLNSPDFQLQCDYSFSPMGSFRRSCFYDPYDYHGWNYQLRVKRLIRAMLVHDEQEALKIEGVYNYSRKLGR